MPDHNFEVGDLVRHRGREVILEEINRPDHPEDEYWGAASSDMGSYDVDIEDVKDVTLVLKAKDIPDPKLPSKDELIDYVTSAILGGLGNIEISETNTLGAEPGTALIVGKFGRTSFSARIRGDQITWWDQ